MTFAKQILTSQNTAVPPDFCSVPEQVQISLFATVNKPNEKLHLLKYRDKWYESSLPTITISLRKLGYFIYFSIQIAISVTHLCSQVILHLILAKSALLM